MIIFRINDGGQDEDEGVWNHRFTDWNVDG